jgi:hypothetical protein
MRKLCGKWVPRVLTIDQNQQRVDDSKQCLAIFNHNKDEFSRRYITMDVTWLVQYTPESNRRSTVWTERDEPNLKRGKNATVSWQGYGIRFAWYYIYRLPQNGPDHQQRVSHSVSGAFKL